MSDTQALAPSEENFKALAIENPEELLRWIAAGSLEAADLTFAAEAASMIDDGKRVADALLPLLAHNIASVREGAIYGLATHTSIEGVTAALEKLSQEDPIAEIRIAATSALSRT